MSRNNSFAKNVAAEALDFNAPRRDRSEPRVDLCAQRMSECPSSSPSPASILSDLSGRSSHEESQPPEAGETPGEYEHSYDTTCGATPKFEIDLAVPTAA
jgi:hypothetical protein